jgi:uncharacterized protein YbjQ (UPF0145 family)
MAIPDDIAWDYGCSDQIVHNQATIASRSDTVLPKSSGGSALAVLVTTTNTIEGRPVKQYLGLACGETILGVNVFKDLAAGFRNIVGGRAGKYEEELRRGRETAIAEMVSVATEMGADAVIGVDIDYETVGGQMLMITAAGTAVKLG